LGVPPSAESWEALDPPTGPPAFFAFASAAGGGAVTTGGGGDDDVPDSPPQPATKPRAAVKNTSEATRVRSEATVIDYL